MDGEISNGDLDRKEKEPFFGNEAKSDLAGLNHQPENILLDETSKSELGKNCYDCVTFKDDNDVILDDLKPDDVIAQLGGCGRFQIVLTIIVHAMKAVVCFGMGMNSFFAFVPNWRCLEFEHSAYQSHKEQFENQTIGATQRNHFNGSRNGSVETDITWDKQCFRDGFKCIRYDYEPGMYTWVTKFDLICDYSWVTATIISVQMIGMVVGSIGVGHIADIFGRKKPFVSSMVILFLFNLLSYFSTSWIMLTVARFFIGIGSAFFLSIENVMVGEFMLSKWRSTAITFPTWQLSTCLFALIAFWLRDWGHMTLITAFAALICVASWFFIPESFRWDVNREKLHAARRSIDRVSRLNKRTIDDAFFNKMCTSIAKQNVKHRETENYSLIVLFKRMALLKLTLPLIVCWFALGVNTYGIGFGLKKLSGNYFFNVFLFAIVSIPGKAAAIGLQIIVGRKFTAYLTYGMCVVGGLVAGIMQNVHIDPSLRGSLTNYFALAASVGVDGAWGPVQTLVVELYPTVARNTAYGFVSTMARIGAVLGPQFVYLEEFIPGLLFFVVATISFLSILCIAVLPETRNATLVDKISHDLNAQRRPENVKC